MATHSDRFVKIRQIIEITANLALITAVVVGLTVFLRHPSSANVGNIANINAPLSQNPPVGTKIDLPGIDWRAHKATLVVAISSACHYCVNSTPFYSQITHSAHHAPVVIVMPQGQEEARAFLQQHSITPNNTVSTDLANIQVQGTPTLLLISSSGTITRSWVGELTETQKKQVIDALNQI
ncbi:MAG TPA: hypothetical protein VK578_13730 [Edaphobacter sp.]|nr:hypothetical protein [Edaphobacter sp.]